MKIKYLDRPYELALMTIAEKYYQLLPEAYYVDPANVPEVEQYLRQQGWMRLNEFVRSIEKAGEGNMNIVLRVQTNSRTFIIKQARPWVEKYPQVAAPTERTVMEAQFYEIIQKDKTLVALTPEIIGLDEGSFVLAMSDLGLSKDMTGLYKKGVVLEDSDLAVIMRFISMLHASFNMTTLIDRIANYKMRTLNHEHFFIYPFEENNGFDLDAIQPGMQALSLVYKRDEMLKSKIKVLGDIYLSDGDTLLHGDYYPGSWLKTDNGIRIIDPEFCFLGPREFDLGVFIAHLKMAQHPESMIASVLDSYSGGSINQTLLANFTGIEIMRRVIGLAQLPLDLSLREKKLLLEEARELVVLS